MSDQSYVYKPKAWTMGLAFAFFGLCAVTSLNSALTNDRGLIIDGLIRLDPGQATIFYWSLTIVAAIMSGLGVVGMARAFTSSQRLIVGESGIRVPKSAFSDALVSISYAHIKNLVRMQVKSQHLLVVHHVNGKTTISASMLPSRAIFDEICRIITERVLLARGI